MKTTNIEKLMIDIETGGFLHSKPMGSTGGLVSEISGNHDIKSHKRKVAIIGVPMGFHITPSMIHYHARAMGRNSMHLLMMQDLIMSGKTVIHASFENGFEEMTEEKIKEKMRGLVITQIPSYSQALKPYSPMKPLAVSYKERFRLNRLKTKTYNYEHY